MLVCAVTLCIALGIVRPLRELRRSANQIADGDLRVDLQVKARAEVGQAAIALGRTFKQLRDYIAYIEGAIRAIENSATIADDTAQNLLQVVQGTQEVTQASRRPPANRPFPSHR